MHCPFCGFAETQVKDSRPSEDGTSIKRRRACPECGARFNTYERSQLRDLVVIKSGDKRQNFERDKIIRSMQVALRKRPITADQMERAVNGIVRQLEITGENEIPSRLIGELVMQSLMELDIIGYIRYASVYRDFSRAEDFRDFVKSLEQLV
ncbi:MAG: transcriptional repressor NrdR [Alphaproteobacteria bacterium]|nr:transcriptional repressor NrdR [Alphaproteobacteria bacterium]